jgi:hypothetical protein
MFSAECPKCKNEIPLGVAECPVCAAKEAAGDSQAEMPAAAPAPQAARYVPPPMSPEPAVRRAAPPWLVMAGVAAVLGGILAGGYLFLLPKLRGSSSAPAKAPPAALEAPPAAPAGPVAHRYGKYIEVAGIRIVEQNKKPVLKLLLVNHAPAELVDVDGKVELRAIGAKPDAPAVGAIEIKVPSIGPYESKELSAPLNTTLRAYELPDWQFLRGTLVE